MSDIYERDFYAWINEQVSLLRAGDIARVDLANVAEELASSSRREKRELRQRLAGLLYRLLKWQVQTGLRSGSWALSLDAARDAVADLLTDSPSLRAELPKTMMAAYRSARREVAIETGFAIGSLPSECPWSFDEAMRTGPTVQDAP